MKWDSAATDVETNLRQVYQKFEETLTQQHRQCRVTRDGAEQMYSRTLARHLTHRKCSASWVRNCEHLPLARSRCDQLNKIDDHKSFDGTEHVHKQQADGQGQVSIMAVFLRSTSLRHIQ